MGSEFYDFLVIVLTFCLIKAFDKARLLEKVIYSRDHGTPKAGEEGTFGGRWRVATHEGQPKTGGDVWNT